MMRGWQPIETAPDLERIVVAGWNDRRGNCAGYWWFHEDMIVDGKPSDHPDALLWHPFPELPDSPPPGGRP